MVTNSARKNVFLVIVFMIICVFVTKTEAAISVSEVKSQLIKSPLWVAIKAYKESDTRICDSSSSPQDCWEYVSTIVFTKKLVNGNCNSLPSQFVQFADLCNALRRSECSSLEGYKKLMCQGILSKDIEALAKAFSDPEFPQFIENKNIGAKMFMNLYYGFKYKNASGCSEYDSDNLLAPASCNMLFGDGNFESRLYSISQDIAYAAAAKTAKDKKGCSRVSNSAVRKACDDDSIADLNGIINIVW